MNLAVCSFKGGRATIPKARVEFKHLKRRMGLEWKEDWLTSFPCQQKKTLWFFFSNLSYTIDSLQRRKREEEARQGEKVNHFYLLFLRTEGDLLDLPQEWKETSHDQSPGDSKKKKKEKRPKLCKKKRSLVMIGKSALVTFILLVYTMSWKKLLSVLSSSSHIILGHESRCFLRDHSGAFKVFFTAATLHWLESPTRLKSVVQKKTMIT